MNFITSYWMVYHCLEFTPPDNVLLNSYFKNLIVRMFYIFLKYMSTFMLIECYLPFDL